MLGHTPAPFLQIRLFALETTFQAPEIPEQPKPTEAEDQVRVPRQFLASFDGLQPNILLILGGPP